MSEITEYGRVYAARGVGVCGHGNRAGNIAGTEGNCCVGDGRVMRRDEKGKGGRWLKGSELCRSAKSGARKKAFCGGVGKAGREPSLPRPPARRNLTRGQSTLFPNSRPLFADDLPVLDVPPPSLSVSLLFARAPSTMFSLDHSLEHPHSCRATTPNLALPSGQSPHGRGG